MLQNLSVLDLGDKMNKSIFKVTPKFKKRAIFNYDSVPSTVLHVIVKLGHDK